MPCIQTFLSKPPTNSPIHEEEEWHKSYLFLNHTDGYDINFALLYCMLSPTNKTCRYIFPSKCIRNKSQKSVFVTQLCRFEASMTKTDLRTTPTSSPCRISTQICVYGMPTLMLNMKLQPAAGELEMCAHAAAQLRRDAISTLPLHLSHVASSLLKLTHILSFPVLKEGSVFWFLVQEGNAPQLQECSMWKKEEEEEKVDRAWKAAEHGPFCSDAKRREERWTLGCGPRCVCWLMKLTLGLGNWFWRRLISLSSSLPVLQLVPLPFVWLKMRSTINTRQSMSFGLRWSFCIISVFFHLTCEPNPRLLWKSLQASRLIFH